MTSSIADPARNMMARPYSSLSVQEVDVELTEASLTALLMGREVYYQTEYLALRRGSEVALVAVRKESEKPLFSPVVDLRVLARPDQVMWIPSSGTDVGNPTAMARAALAHTRPGVQMHVVQGRFEHVNFIWQPVLTRVRVRDVVPPQSPKLFEMAQEVLAFDEQLPPIELVLDAVDIRELAAEHPAQSYLLPCGGSQIQLGVPVEFLDTRPKQQPGWLLIACEQSRKIYRHFYGENPTRVDICPMRRIDRSDPGLELAKCCLIPQGIRVVGHAAVVPWGASRDEIRQALRVITGIEAPPSTAFDPVDDVAGSQPDSHEEHQDYAGVHGAIKC
jgi:hypothetical protein